jgi:tetratricopeptide (TPR) repeat protein
LAGIAGEAYDVERRQVTIVRDAKFWVAMAVFQVLFGIAVFAVTRVYYMQHPASASAQPSTINPPPAVDQPSVAAPGDITELARARLSHSSSSSGGATTQDPVELSRQAAQAFSNQQYDRALDLYGQLLTLSPKNVDILNELGLTLHYLGRSDEALRRLNEGVAIDPKHQRIRLTLGFVNSQMGNIKEARAALTAATQLGTDESIRQSARDMLKKLPQ